MLHWETAASNRWTLHLEIPNSEVHKEPTGQTQGCLGIPGICFQDLGTCILPAPLSKGQNQRSPLCLNWHKLYAHIDRKTESAPFIPPSLRLNTSACTFAWKCRQESQYKVMISCKTSAVNGKKCVFRRGCWEQARAVQSGTLWWHVKSYKSFFFLNK